MHTFEKPCPIAAPICTEGPSRPTDNPAINAAVPPINLNTKTLSQLTSSLFISMPSTCGIPLPEIIGSFFTKHPTKKPIKPSITNTNNIVNGWPLE